MNFESLLEPARKKPVRAVLMGAGEFGLSLISQAARTPGLEVVGSVDLDADRTTARINQHMQDATFARACMDPAQAASKAQSGSHVVADNIDVLLALEPDIVVEATGHATAGTDHALRAIAAGVGVVMVSKEAECVVGPELARRARAAGVPYTLVEGDQPALLVSLISRARALGLTIIAAGKSSEYDYVFNADGGTVTWTGQSVSANQIGQLWDLGDDRAATLEARSHALADLPQHTVADYCEMNLVINATGFMPDGARFHAPLTRANELQDVYVPVAEGGILSAPGRIDVFNNLRRHNEASFAGGVFVVVEWPDGATGQVLRGKGIPTSQDGKYGVIYNPSHLLGVEAPISIIAAGRIANQYTDANYKPRIDLVARAETELAAGTQLGIVGLRHAVPGLAPEFAPYQRRADAAPIPYYMAVDQTLARDVKPGNVLTYADIVPPEQSVLWATRAEMDQAFEPASTTRDA